ncbi:uridine diphosphate glucose pyrophosphatase NUDT22 isoform X2 [Lampris incognitus]|uniref:uridine diphosphate glucose pyrophosphatase NUDT22 isoform X2 n=1 Tax=Lampris incognitus TaxID=2546036 RepID=UPI0024B59A6A|nr:uridine diphosphate glucose pyrophosphatase NUDT22 isoform X2 [Lampris incognitus]
MDPEVSVLLHCAAWRGLLQAQVQVELSERYNSQTDAALECHIEEVWTERVSKEPWLFNGAKFRLHSFSLASPKPPSLPSVCSSPTHFHCLDCAGDKHSPQQHGSQQREENLCDDSEILNRRGASQKILQEGCGPGHHQVNGDCSIQLGCHLTHSVPKDRVLTKASSTSGSSFDGTTANFASRPHRADCKAVSPVLTLRLGLTCYKDFLGTNWSHQVGELRRRGEVEFGDPLALLAQPLGVGGVLCTSDGRMVLIRRSQQVAEAGGLLDIPGGHPEPKAVCEEQICMATLQQRPQAVVAELFRSVCAEISDEVNVPLSSLGIPVLMGIAVNHTSAGRPSAEFYIRTCCNWMEELLCGQSCVPQPKEQCCSISS